MRVRVGHSPDPDDAFMYWAIAAGRVDTRGHEFEQVVADIETLNGWALEGRLEVTALSAGAYPHVRDRYDLLPHGASLGDGYGPVVVAREPLEPRRPRGPARGRARPPDDRVPRRAARAAARSRRCWCPFDEVLDRVAAGDVDAGRRHPRGPARLAGRGPLAGRRPRRLVARRDRAAAAARRRRDPPRPAGRTSRPRCRRCCCEAIDAGLANRPEALAYAQDFGRGIDAETERPLRRDVRQRADPRLRPARPRGHRRADPPRHRDRRVRQMNGHSG